MCVAKVKVQIIIITFLYSKQTYLGEKSDVGSWTEIGLKFTSNLGDLND